MFSKKPVLLMILAATVALPYLLSEGGFGKLKDKWTSLTSNSSSDTPLAAVTGSEISATRGTAGFAEAPLTGPRVADLGEVFHFGITPEWIMGNWSRVTTTVGDLELEGLRVALLTGPRTDDVCGSLTYYFDANRQLQRITFHGYTGDASRLATLVTKHYDFQQFPVSGAALYMKRWNGKPRGVLMVDFAPVVEADNDRSRLLVRMELNNTLGRYQLSNQMAVLLKQRGI